MPIRWFISASLALLLPTSLLVGEAEKGSSSPFAEYFRAKVEELSSREPCLKFSRENWAEERDRARSDLARMLGLEPMPEKTDLQPVVTGTIERSGIVVEKLHFQSLPGLYVTANFYRPAHVDAPLPTILYLCGHARVVIDGVSYGNKVGYQHHGAWFARNGYCCLMIDTIQLGEMEGVHHGTYRQGMWWWIARGYTPAGVEAWNAIRALDYLETRPEVDRQKIGVTGRSGGGAYTWWVAALDDRPVCFVPVAGITDLRNHVIDNCIEGHCDCMFMVNRDGWDFATLAALAAPRPCLLANTDKDGIFPLDGVVRIHERLRDVYQSLGAEEKLGLLITEGPHQDTQDLQVPAFRWFNRWLKGSVEPISDVAEKLFQPAELKVFDELPSDSHNAQIHEEFISLAEVGEPPGKEEDWRELRERWIAELAKQSFASWPKEGLPFDIREISVESGGARERTLEFESEPGIWLRLRIVGSPKQARQVVLHVVDDKEETYASRRPDAVPADEAWVFVAPRGWDVRHRVTDAKKANHVPRRFVLLGSTIDEGRVWDVRRALAVLRKEGFTGESVALAGRGIGAGISLYAGVFEPGVSELFLEDLPASHREGPIFMNVLRVLDLPQGVALAFPRPVHLRGVQESDWAWTKSVSSLFGAEKGLLQFEAPMPPAN